jgi:drug/metabolite transporter (DMT)-like permease
MSADAPARESERLTPTLSWPQAILAIGIVTLLIGVVYFVPGLAPKPLQGVGIGLIVAGCLLCGTGVVLTRLRARS